jgi:WD40 repeat protein
MTETDIDLAIRGTQIEPWSCTQANHKHLDQYACGQRHRIVEDPGSFTKMALAGDGNTLAAVAGRVLCVFNTRTRERLDRLVFYHDIEHVTINANGQVLFLADATQAIHVVDIPFAYRCQIATHDKGIAAMTVDCTGSRLAIADNDGLISILDTSDFSKLSTLDCGFVPRRILIRRDRDWLLAFAKGEIAAYRFSTAEQLARYGAENQVTEPFDLAGEFLITETQSGFVVRDSALGDSRFVPSMFYEAFDTTPDGSIYVTAQSSRLSIWDPIRGEEARYVRTYVCSVADVKICGEGQSIYVCGNNATIECFAVSGERVATFSDFRVPIMAAATTSDDRRLVVAGGDGTLAVYDLVTGDANRFHQHSCCISKLYVNDESLVATGAHDGWARVLDLDSGNEIFSVNFPGSPVQAVTLDGNRFLVTGNYLGQVHRYDLDSHDLVAEYHGNTCTVRSVSVSPNGLYLMTTNENSDVLVFDYESGDQINEFHGAGTSYTGCFDESGEFLYFGDGSGRVVKARPESKRASRRWDLHTTDVRSIRIQGQHLVSIGMMDDAYILDPGSGKILLTCPVDTKPFHRVAFTNSVGTRLVTGGEDGSLMFRDAADGSILAELRNLAHGFLWLTHDDKNDSDLGDCFWTDQDEMIQVYDRRNGIETLLAPSGKEHHDYVRIHNNQAMTMARVGMTPGAVGRGAELQMTSYEASMLDWNPLSMLEHLPG